MSRTKFVGIDDRGFWAVDDALDVWLAYLVEAVGDAGSAEVWLSDLVDDWRRGSALADIGVAMRLPVAVHRERVRGIAERARGAARAGGDVSVERLRQWVILGDSTVSDGFSRTPDGVGVDRILEVADGFLGLLNGTLAADPPHGWWYLGTGAGMSIIERGNSH
ncbi:hypothetical protein AB0M22_45300 [Nocardia sp. NPDC051756]|uniref:hypothetical protein n=1 Tax=Nocardia sp. NPDC051756 TaxID=3154751 RepID=UPI00342B3233